MVKLPRRPPRKRYKETYVIAIANQKGGVGKTTTSINLAASLAMMGHKTLLVDMDSQGHSSSGVGLDKSNLKDTVYDILIGEKSVDDVKWKSGIPGLDVIPSNITLSGATIDLVGSQDMNYRLKDALEKVHRRYDFILIDTPPSLGILTLNSLVASNAVLVPLQCEYFAVEGVKDLLNVLHLVQEKLNHSLELEGILLTMYEGHKMARDIEQEIKGHFKSKVYRAKVPRDRNIGIAPSHGKPAVSYNPNSPGAQAYIKFALEFKRRRGLR